MTASARYKPEILVVPDAEQAAAEAAARVERQVCGTPRIVLGLATGRTFLPFYEALVQAYRQGRVSFAGTTSFNLDEYVGLPPGDPASFGSYMTRHFFSRTDIDRSRTHLPMVAEGRLEDACTGYESAIAAVGGIDLQLLGLGRNGHIGFNEPGSARTSRTRVVSLSSSTIDANLGDFRTAGDVPQQAVTMGIGTILEAGRILLLVTGQHKAEALALAFTEPPCSSCPASFLQYHPHVTVICDAEAAYLLPEARGDMSIQGEKIG